MSEPERLQLGRAKRRGSDAPKTKAKPGQNQGQDEGRHLRRAVEETPPGEEEAHRRDVAQAPHRPPHRHHLDVAARLHRRHDDRRGDAVLHAERRARAGHSSAAAGRHDPVLRRQRDGPHRHGEPGDRHARPGAQAGAVRRARRRGPQLLQRARRLDHRHDPRRAQRSHRRRHPGRLGHHPAVREERLPEQRAHAEPQAQRACHRGEAQPRLLQGPDPRVLPQHCLLRPRHVRHRGRVACVFRQERQQALGVRGCGARGAAARTVLLRPGGQPG